MKANKTDMSEATVRNEHVLTGVRSLLYMVCACSCCCREFIGLCDSEVTAYGDRRRMGSGRTERVKVKYMVTKDQALGTEHRLHCTDVTKSHT